MSRNGYPAGFTLVEVLVVVGIILVLAGFLFPLFGRAREQARQTTCLAHQQQLAQAVLLWAGDHDEMLPGAATVWQDLALDPRVLQCPRAPSLPRGYVYNGQVDGCGLHEMPFPERTVLTADGENADGIALSVADYVPRHHGHNLASYADGHVEVMGRAPRLLFTLNRASYEVDRHATDQHIYLANADGTDRQDLTADMGNTLQPRFSPDGSRIVFEADDDIYVMDVDGENRRNLTNAPSYRDGNRAPCFSPDGKRIAFTSHRGGRCRVYVMDADGGNVQCLTREGLSTDSPVFSPDGMQIAFHAIEGTDGKGGVSQIYIIGADGTGERQLTQGTEHCFTPAYSPDGRLIVYDRWGDDNMDVWIMNADGSEPHNLTDHPAGDALPVFGPDGRSILFLSNRNSRHGDGDPRYPYVDLYRINLDGTHVQQLTHLDLRMGLASYAPW